MRRLLVVTVLTAMATGCTHCGTRQPQCCRPYNMAPAPVSACGPGYENYGPQGYAPQGAMMGAPVMQGGQVWTSAPQDMGTQVIPGPQTYAPTN